MTDSLTERVARALCSNDASVNPELQDKVWHIYEKDARTAILETLRGIREPSKGMVRAGDMSGYKASVRTVSSDVWQAMIDTLIAELEPSCDT